MRAGVTGEKDLLHVKHEFDKINKPKPKNPNRPKQSVDPKPRPKLNVQIHGIPVRRPQKWAMKCPVCTDVFQLVKDLNSHVKEKHPKFQYKCKYCTKKFQNFASKYKHKRKHGLPNHVCDQCQKGFFFKKDLIVHIRVHSGQGLFPCTNCPNKCNT